MFILDTNVVSELRKAAAGRANNGVTDWANSVPATLMFMSVITLHELEREESCSPNAATPQREPSSEPGSTTASTPPSQTASCPLTPRSPANQPHCTYPTPHPSETPLSQPPPSTTT